MQECPICGGVKTQLIFSGAAPDACTNLPTTVIEAVSVDIYPLQMRLCLDCKHVFNEEEITLRYSEYPMYNRGWKRHVQQQANFLKGMSPCKKCVDIGGGDCGFLELVAEEGYCIDPNGKSDKFKVFTEYQEGMIREINPDTIILRHTLEHFLEPRKVIQGIVDEAGEGAFFFIEVPNVEKTLERKWFCDFMPAHPQNFTRNSLIELLYSVGLKLQVLYVTNSGTVLTFSGTKEKGDRPFHYNIAPCEGFDFLGLELQVAQLAKRGILFWGAAGKGASFLNQVAPETLEVYDSDSRKVGKYVPGTGQRIKGIDEIPSERNKIFATAPWRANDIYRELNRVREFDIYTYSNDMVGMV